MPLHVDTLLGQSSFGAVVTRLELGDLAHSDARETLRALWIDRGVVVFRGLEGGADSGILRPVRLPNRGACGVPADERRHMQRTTIAGDCGHGRIEGQGELTEEMRRYNV